MAPSVVERTQECLDHFKGLLADSVGRRLLLSNPYRLVGDHNGVLDWPRSWCDVWQRRLGAAVYLKFDRNGRLLYVGSAVSVEKRLAAYYQYENGRGSACKIVDPNMRDVAAIRIIAFDDDIKYLALALEWSLIEMLDPPQNNRLRQKKRTGELDEKFRSATPHD